MVRESAKGSRAAQLLNSDIYLESMERVEAGILDAWKSSPIRDAEGQTYLRLMMKCLTDLQGHIKDVAETGKMAEVQLNYERTLSERARDAVTAFRKRA